MADDLNETTIIEWKYLISRDTYSVKGAKAIIESAKDNINTLINYEDITEDEYEQMMKGIHTDFDKTMDRICDLLEMDYRYAEQ